MGVCGGLMFDAAAAIYQLKVFCVCKQTEG